MSRSSGETLARSAAALLGGSLASHKPLPGGDLSTILHIRLTDGREAVVKDGPSPRTEAAMLRALAATGTPVPDVLAVSGTALVLQAIPTTGGPGSAWGSLGGVLARLHATTGQAGAGAPYGWPEDYAFGLVPVENAPCADWAAFWAERRLMPHLPHVAPGIGRRVETLAAGLASRLPRHPAPSLLHGDLWSGNVLAAGDTIAALIDPACIYGHAEADLAMLSLFGSPDAAFWAAYGAPAPGFAERLPVYQLWPALVHLRLFGAGYLGLVERLLGDALAR